MSNEIQNSNVELTPQELIQETLQDLIDFSFIIEKISRKAASCIGDKAAFLTDFIQLIESLALFTEAVSHVRQVIGLDIFRPVNRLEKDLLIILKDLESSHGNEADDSISVVLENYLPENLQQWREVGIPALMSVRDS
jgi:hypothetical protein